MLDSPPPSTITSGSSRLITWPAPAPAGRHAAPAPPAPAASPAAARAGMPLASRASGPSQSTAPAPVPDRPGLQAAALPAPALRPRDIRPASARAAGLWPHSPAMRCAPCDAPAHPPRCRRRSRCRGSRRTPPRCPAPAPSGGLADSAKQLASFSTRTSRPSARRESRGRRDGRSAPMELAFFTSPVAGLITPGMPMPTLAAPPSSCSALAAPARRSPSIDRRHSPGGVGMRRRSSYRRRPAPATTISVLVPPRSMPMRKSLWRCRLSMDVPLRLLKHVARGEQGTLRRDAA